MSDGDALLRTILERPAEDTPRLVYADWLEERGQGARAALIRMGVKIGQTHMTCARTGCELAINGRGGPAYVKFCRCTPCSLVRKQWRLNRELTKHPDQFAAALPVAVNRLNGFRERRGMVFDITIPLADFMEYAEALFRAHPIERVTLTAKEPWHETETDSWLWVIGPDADNPSALPKALWRHLPMSSPYGPSRYQTLPLATAALSQACVAYGRECAGLSACRVNSDHAAQTE